MQSAQIRTELGIVYLVSSEILLVSSPCAAETNKHNTHSQHSKSVCNVGTVGYWFQKVDDFSLVFPMRPIRIILYGVLALVLYLNIIN